jgi:hypothetical protein
MYNHKSQKDWKKSELNLYNRRFFHEDHFGSLIFLGKNVRSRHI